jgi:hypothetical protein
VTIPKHKNKQPNKRCCAYFLSEPKNKPNVAQRMIHYTRQEKVWLFLLIVCILFVNYWYIQCMLYFHLTHSPLFMRVLNIHLLHSSCSSWLVSYICSLFCHCTGPCSHDSLQITDYWLIIPLS